MYEYNGYRLEKDVEVESDGDNMKTYHMVYGPDGKYITVMDWSPYSDPTEYDFKLWVELDRPTRQALRNGGGPLNHEDLITIANSIEAQTRWSLLSQSGVK